MILFLPTVEADGKVHILDNGNRYDFIFCNIMSIVSRHLSSLFSNLSGRTLHDMHMHALTYCEAI